jgi:Major Facilitator Superfamily
VTFTLLAGAAISYALLQSLVAPALPDIQHALHTSVNSVSWVLTAYLLSASIATPLIGRLGDMYGKERLLVGVLIVLCVATTVSALATSLAVMLVGRVVQGAAGGVFPLAFGIIRDEFPRERVAGAIGGHVCAGRRRRRRRRRTVGADRRPPVVPRALLAAAVPARGDHDRRPLLRARVPHPGGRTRQLDRHGAHVGRPRGSPPRGQPGSDLALAVGEDADRPRDRRRVPRCVGAERNAEPIPARST